MSVIQLDFPMPITTKRLLIRLPQIGDGAIINPAVVESIDILKLYMPWAQTLPSVDDSEEFIRTAAANWILKKNEEPYLPLLIFEKNTMKFIGTTGWHHYNWDIPAFETGYWLHSAYQQQGFMTEAIHALTRFTFEVLRANRLEIRCDSNNIRSKKLAERLGFQLEGTLHNHRLDPHTKALSDTLIYARTTLNNLSALDVQWGLSE
jgi:ribosomal-protein-serine acetyltransferase